MTKLKLLYVDDETVNLTNFQIAFRRKYQVVTAGSGHEALQLFDQNDDIAIVVADQRMPGMSGVELLHAIKGRNEDVVRIILTAYTDTNDIIESINKGYIYQYVLKPWVQSDLEQLLGRAAEKYLLVRENKQLVIKLQQDLEKREELEANLVRRDLVLAYVAKMAVTLLMNKNWEQYAKELSANLGGVMAVSRVRLFQHRTGADGALYAAEKFGWVAEHLSGHIGEEGGACFTYTDLKLARWYACFEQQELVAGNIGDFPDDEASWLKEAHIHSIVCVPITVGKDCWGFISFEDSQGDRRWAQPELDALKTSAMLIGTAINRDMMEADLASQQVQVAHAGRLTALGEMACGIGHEINQPLSVINLNTESCLTYLAMHNPDSVAIDILNDIKWQVEKITRLIDGMRRFSRFSSGQLEKLCISEPLGNALNFFREQFLIHGIELDVKIGQKLPRVQCDCQKLEQVVANILSNARHAVEEKERGMEGTDYRKKVTVRLDYVNPDEPEMSTVMFKKDDTMSGQGVRLMVQDNGIGMSRVVQERCLDPFFTTKAVGDGTGLGLSVSYGIIQELNYHLNIESSEGEGTTFRLYMPVGKEDVV